MAEREAAAGINFQGIPGEIKPVVGQNAPLELPPPPDEFQYPAFNPPQHAPNLELAAIKCCR